MKIQVKAFGVVRDMIGTSFEIDMEGVTVGDLRSALLARFPELGGLNSLMVAVNLAYAENDVELRTEDEVVLIPPVSGG